MKNYTLSCKHCNLQRRPLGQLLRAALRADQIFLLLPQICAWMASPPAWDSNDSAASPHGGKAPGRGAPPTRSERRQFMAQKFSAKRQVYENCRMLSKQGELLCYCDARKVLWYEASHKTSPLRLEG